MLEARAKRLPQAPAPCYPAPIRAGNRAPSICMPQVIRSTENLDNFLIQNDWLRGSPHRRPLSSDFLNKAVQSLRGESVRGLQMSPKPIAGWNHPSGALE